jgi:hypothetical protein
MGSPRDDAVAFMNVSMGIFLTVCMYEIWQNMMVVLMALLTFMFGIGVTCGGIVYFVYWVSTKSEKKSTPLEAPFWSTSLKALCTLEEKSEQNAQCNTPCGTPCHSNTPTVPDLKPEKKLQVKNASKINDEKNEDVDKKDEVKKDEIKKEDADKKDEITKEIKKDEIKKL